jgi:hypothetical protein
MSNKDDLEKKLKELGLDPGAWKKGGDRKVSLKFLTDKLEQLGTVRDLLKAQLEADKKELQKAIELQKKLKKGGCSGDG